jgi:2'-5' RNA ligase
MNCDPNNDTDRINLYALVSYIPGALGDFLDRLREELVMGCDPHAHITVLPPRPVARDHKSSLSIIESRIEEFSPFQVEITGIKLFPVTNVIYASIGTGCQEMVELHDTLNIGALKFDEPFKYHPHITLAQNVDPADVFKLRELAERRWQESAPTNKFVVDTLTFVQSTAANQWIDLMSYELGAARSRR